MPAARMHSSPLPAVRGWLDAHGGVAGLVDALRAPRPDADELADARELLSYWERRARRLPRWALVRRREARAMAARWRERVRAAEQARYGRGILGAASMYALERRAPVTVAHAARRTLRIAGYAVACTVATVMLVAVAAMAVVAEALLSAL